MKSVLAASNIALIIMTIQNIVFTRGFGIDEALDLARKPKRILPFSLILIGMTTLSSIGVYYMNQLFFKNKEVYYYVPLIVVASIAFVYFLALGIIYLIAYQSKKTETVEFFRAYTKYMPRSSFNCAVVGTVLLSFNMKATLAQMIVSGIGAGLGFLLAVLVMREGRVRLEKNENIPRHFQGMPAQLIYLGILSLALYGLIGYQLPY